MKLPNFLNIGTFRSLIETSLSLDNVYKYINDKDSSYISKCDKPTIKETIAIYSKVINELLSKPKVKKYKYPIVLQMVKDMSDSINYVDVSLKNLKYIAPKKGLEPWGCTKKGEKPPKGYYDCNKICHSKYFAFGFTPWSKIIDTNVIVEQNAFNLKKHEILGEILWELTFYGWTEKKQQKQVKILEKELSRRMKDIDAGNYITLDELNEKIKLEKK